MRQPLPFAAVLCMVAALAPRAGAGDPAREATPYPTAHDAPLHATEGGAVSDSGIRRVRVEFDGIEGDRVPAYVYVAEDDVPRHPAVLLQYGSGGHKDTDYIVALGRQFAARGFLVLTIDAPGRGERKGVERKLTDWIRGSKGREDFLHYCGDYSRAVDYLVSRKDVDAERIAYVGLSWGAITGVTFVAHDARVKAMASICGGGGFLDLAGLLGGGGPSVDPVRHVAGIAPRPLLLVNGKRDLMIPLPFSEALHNAAGKGARKVWLDTDHLFNGVDRAALGESVIDFVEDALQPPL